MALATHSPPRAMGHGFEKREVMAQSEGECWAGSSHVLECMAGTLGAQWCWLISWRGESCTKFQRNHIVRHIKLWLSLSPSLVGHSSPTSDHYLQGGLFPRLTGVTSNIQALWTLNQWVPSFPFCPWLFFGQTWGMGEEAVLWVWKGWQHSCIPGRYQIGHIMWSAHF